MDIEFIGAAQTVTGSKHLVHDAERDVLLDCGLFQGTAASRFEQNRSWGSTPRRSTPSSSRMPTSTTVARSRCSSKAGYDGPIYCTPATRDLCAAMLTDAASIQDRDARYINQQIRSAAVRRWSPSSRSTTRDDVMRTLGQMMSVPYQRRRAIAPGVTLTSSTPGTSWAVRSRCSTSTRSASAAPGVHGRSRSQAHPHPARPGMPTGRGRPRHGEHVRRSHAPPDGGHGRQARRGPEAGLRARWQDHHPELRPRARAGDRLRAQGAAAPGALAADPRVRRLAADREDHRRLQAAPGVLRRRDARAHRRATTRRSTSTSCSYVSSDRGLEGDRPPRAPRDRHLRQRHVRGGPVLHHLKAGVEDPKNAVLIVGLPGAATLGRRIAERRPRVQIFGVERDLRAEVVVLEGSARTPTRRTWWTSSRRVDKGGKLRERDPRARRPRTAEDPDGAAGQERHGLGPCPRRRRAAGDSERRRGDDLVDGSLSTMTRRRKSSERMPSASSDGRLPDSTILADRRQAVDARQQVARAEVEDLSEKMASGPIATWGTASSDPMRPM